MKINKHSNRKRRILLMFAFLGVAGWIFVTQFYIAINYPDQNYPYYSDTYALASSNSVKTLTVVSYNIWFAEAIDQAISEMQMIESQNGLDIILLQEMDEVGTEKIAHELQMNYIYFPRSNRAHL